jgi:hypothetical protein
MEIDTTVESVHMLVSLRKSFPTCGKMMIEAPSKD